MARATASAPFAAGLTLTLALTLAVSAGPALR